MENLNISITNSEKLARYCGSLGNPRRITLITKVASNQNCVKNHIVEVEGLNKFAIGMNLKYLKKFGLINGTLTSKKLQYCINYKNLEEFKTLFDEFYNLVITNKANIESTETICSSKSQLN